MKRRYCMPSSEKRGQGTFEYVLLLGGVLLIVVLALVALPSNNQVDKKTLCAAAARSDTACFYANGTFNNYTQFYFNLDKKFVDCNCSLYEAVSIIPTVQPSVSSTPMPSYQPETRFTVNTPLTFGTQTCNPYAFDASDADNFRNCQQVTGNICKYCFKSEPNAAPADSRCPAGFGPYIPADYQYGSAIFWQTPAVTDQPAFICIGPPGFLTVPTAFNAPYSSFGCTQPTDGPSLYACMQKYNDKCKSINAKGGIVTSWDSNSLSGFCISNGDATNTLSTFPLPLGNAKGTCNPPASGEFFSTNCRLVFDEQCRLTGHFLGGLPVSWDAAGISGFCFG